MGFPSTDTTGPGRAGRGKRLVSAFLGMALAAVATLAAVDARAAFPDKPITVIVPYPVGGATDLLARIVGRAMGEALHQSVVVENRAGGSGFIGMAAAARAPADGYTILFGCVADAAIYQAAAVNTPPVNLKNDFAPIAGIATAPHILVVPSALPVNNFRELTTYLKASPGKYNYASIGVATLSQLEPELLELTTGIDIVHVPYKGGAQALMELTAGNSSLMFLSGPNAMPHVKANKVKVLAVASDKRLSLFPDVPTIAESGVQGFDARNLFGFFAPKGTPAAIVETLSKVMGEALANVDIKARLEDQGLQPAYANPRDFAQQTAADFKFFDEVVKKAGIRLD